MGELLRYAEVGIRFFTNSNASAIAIFKFIVALPVA